MRNIAGHLDAGMQRDSRQFRIAARGRDGFGASALRAQRMTLRPARAATPASAVPHAPAPMTAMELKEVMGRSRRCALLSLPPRSGGEGRPKRSEGQGGGRPFRASTPHPDARLWLASTLPAPRYARGGRDKEGRATDVIEWSSISLKTPHANCGDRSARPPCRRAASAHAARCPSYRSGQARAVRRRPRRSSRHCRCRARAAG